MVDLYLASGNQKQTSEARYSMTTVDLQHSPAKNGKFAIFIVPQGKCCGLQSCKSTCKPSPHTALIARSMAPDT